jgi:hypothetical protein
MEKLNSPPPVAETKPEDENSNLEFSDDLLKDIGINTEVNREETLSQLEVMHGGRVFAYGQYSGTVREIADSCPAFNFVLNNGVEAAAAWLEANDEPEETTEDESENNEELVEEPDEKEKEDEKTQEEQQTSEKEPEKIEKKTEKKLEKEIPEITEPLKLVEVKKDEDITSIATKESEAKNKDVALKNKEDFKEPNKIEIKAETIEVAKDQNLEEAVDRVEEVTSNPELEFEGILDSSENTSEIIENENEVSEIEEPEAIQKDEAKAVPAESIKKPALELVKPLDEIEPKETQKLELIKEVTPESIKNVFEETKIPDEEPFILENPEIMLDSEEALVEEEQPTIIDRVLESELEQQSEPELEIQLNDLNSKAGELVDIINEDQENVFNTIELVPEMSEIISELTQETPKVELSMQVELNQDFEPTQIYQQASIVIKKIEILEKARTAEECKEALKGLRLELADLLQKFGYTEYDYLVERLIQNYDVATLKRYMAAMMQKIIKSRKTKSHRNRQTKDLSARKYGSPAVRNVINLTLVQN